MQLIFTRSELAWLARSLYMNPAIGLAVTGRHTDRQSDYSNSRAHACRELNIILYIHNFRSVSRNVCSDKSYIKSSWILLYCTGLYTTNTVHNVIVCIILIQYTMSWSTMYWVNYQSVPCVLARAHPGMSCDSFKTAARLPRTPLRIESLTPVKHHGQPGLPNCSLSLSPVSKLRALHSI